MRVVRDRGRARRGARGSASARPTAAFGDGTLYCERYLERPRHVEVPAARRRARERRRARRARLLGAAAPPEGARGGPCAAARPMSCEARSLDAAIAFGRAIGYRSAGTGRVRRRRRRVLLPRAERPHPGRAPGHRGSRPGSTSSPSSSASPPANPLQQTVARSRARRRGSPLCRGSTHVSPSDRIDRRGFVLPSDSLSQLPPRPRYRVDAGSRKATRSGSSYDSDDRQGHRSRSRPRRGARPARHRSRGDRSRGCDDQPCRSSAGSSRIPYVRAGEATTAFLTENPPLRPSPTPPPSRSPGIDLGGSTCPRPAPAPPPDVDTSIAVPRPAQRGERPSSRRCRAR